MSFIYRIYYEQNDISLTKAFYKTLCSLYMKSCIFARWKPPVKLSEIINWQVI